MFEYLKQFYTKLTEERWWYTLVITFRWVLLAATAVSIFVFSIWNEHWVLLWLDVVIFVTALIVGIRIADNDLITKN